MFRWWAILIFLISARAQNALTLRGASAAAVVLDVPTSHEVFHYGDIGSTALPGSTLKPFLLDYALNHRVLTEHDTVDCEGNLRVAGHNLSCVHSRSIVVMDARLALSQSCNVYFASLARRLGSRVPDALRVYGLDEPRPSSSDESVLLALGLTGRPVTVRELAVAYRQLAMEMNGIRDRGTLVVRDAMLDSVRSGMAHAAFTSGVDLAGKTGTTPHAGWFAGIVFDRSGRATRVLVVLVPEGNGNDASLFAHRVLAGKR